MIITAVTVSLTIISVAAIALLLARTSEVRELKRKNSDLSNTAHDLRVKRNHDRKFIESIHHRNVTLVKHVENMSRRLACYEGRVAPLDYAEALVIDGKRLVQSVRECCTQLPDIAQKNFDLAAKDADHTVVCNTPGTTLHDDVIPKQHLNADKYRGDKHAD